MPVWAERSPDGAARDASDTFEEMPILRCRNELLQAHVRRVACACATKECTPGFRRTPPGRRQTMTNAHATICLHVRAFMRH